MSELDILDTITDMSGKFASFRYHLKDLHEGYREGRIPMKKVASDTASRITRFIIGNPAYKNEAPDLKIIVGLLREHCYIAHEYDRIMKKIIG